MSDLGADWEARVDWDELRQVRVRKMREAMKAQGLSGLLVARTENVKYLTSAKPFYSMIYYPRYAAFLPLDGELVFLVEAGDYEMDRIGMPWIRDLRKWPWSTEECLALIGDIVRENKLTNSPIGFDDIVSPGIIDGLRKSFASAQIVDGTQVIGEAKAVKHPEEVKILRKSAEVAEVGMEAGLKAVGENVKECEVAGEATRAMFAAGADCLASHPQVSTSPLRRMATDKRIRRGEMVLIDLNVIYNGYIGDFARTTIVGTPTKEQKATYQAQLNATLRAIEAVKPGAKTASLHEIVREVVTEAGLTEYWHKYLTAHGVGTGFAPYELPMIGETVSAPRELKAGMVMAFEPGIFRPGVGPVRVEEMVLVTDTNHEILTKTAYDQRLLD